ncbi:putative 11-oxo-beta-amyrin 30-oxidase [Helianthus debilis subsp. tardiflorus]
MKSLKSANSFTLLDKKLLQICLLGRMILLCQHTNWQDRARAEVLEMSGDRKLDIDGLNRLKNINMILHEVLRFYSPGVGIRRMIHEETKVGNFTLPSGSHLMLHLMLLHYNTEIWGDNVNEFNPERFAEDVSNATKEQASFFPLGGGGGSYMHWTKFRYVGSKTRTRYDSKTLLLRAFTVILACSTCHSRHATAVWCSIDIE